MFEIVYPKHSAPGLLAVAQGATFSWGPRYAKSKTVLWYGADRFTSKKPGVWLDDGRVVNCITCVVGTRSVILVIFSVLKS